MRNFFLRIRAAWLFSKVHPHIPHAPDWTQEDAKQLAIFMERSATGRKLAVTLWHHVQSCQFRATLERNHAQYECGYASGARALAAVFDSLSVIRETPAENQADAMKGIPEELRSLVNQ